MKISQGIRFLVLLGLITVVNLGVLEARAPSATIPPRSDCGRAQQLSCCTAIVTGIGIGCIPVASCNQVAACCRQSGLVNICIPVAL
jgi:hypothetical protein